MISNHAYESIAALDLAPIKQKLMHSEAGEGWTLEHATVVETEYRRFLYLMKAYPDVQTAPMVDVDTFWHYHILDTMKYAADCAQAFGYFVHHFPYLGLRGEDDARELAASGERMRELYEEVFQQPYGANMAAWCCKAGEPVVAAAPVEAAWCCKAAPLQAAPIVPKVRTGAAWCCKAAEPVLAAPVVPKARTEAAWCCKAASY